MKFTANAEVLAAGCRKASSYTARSAESMNSMLHLETANNKLVIRAGNGTAAYKVILDVTTVDPGVAVVPADKLSALVSQLSGEYSFFTEKKNKADKFTIHSEMDGVKLTTSLRTVDASRYPEEIIPETVVWNELPGEALYAALKNVMPIISKNTDTSNRGLITQTVHVEPVDGGIVLVVTDGKALVYEKVELDHEVSDFKNLEIPASFAGMFMSLIQKEEKVQFGWDASSTRLYVKTETEQASSILYVVEYPQWRRVVPRDLANKTKVSLDLLQNAINIVSVTADTVSHKIFLTFQDDSICISSNDSNNESMQVIPAETTGGKLEILFSELMLMKSIKQLKDNACIESVSAQNAVVIHDERENGPVYVLMPMQK